MTTRSYTVPTKGHRLRHHWRAQVGTWCERSANACLARSDDDGALMGRYGRTHGICPSNPGLRMTMTTDGANLTAAFVKDLLVAANWSAEQVRDVN